MRERFTRADFDLLPEGFPAQLVGGCLVRDDPPTYGQRRLASRVLGELASVVGTGLALPAPVDVRIDEWNVFRPDVVVLRQVPADWETRDMGIPVIAIQVVSPASARLDRGVKRRRMVKAGVGEVWIVDRAAGLVECHDAEGCRTATGVMVLSSKAVPAFSLTPATLFSPPV